jgi:hypothetical protein
MEDESGSNELNKRFEQAEAELLEITERQISAQRRRLHVRIDFLRANGNADGTPATQEQLDALDAEERKLSAARRALHTEIDALRGKA